MRKEIQDSILPPCLQPVGTALSHLTSESLNIQYMDYASAFFFLLYFFFKDQNPFPWVIDMCSTTKSQVWSLEFVSTNSPSTLSSSLTFAWVRGCWPSKEVTCDLLVVWWERLSKPRIPWKGWKAVPPVVFDRSLDIRKTGAHTRQRGSAHCSCSGSCYSFPQELYFAHWGWIPFPKASCMLPLLSC